MEGGSALRPASTPLSESLDASRASARPRPITSGAQGMYLNLEARRRLRLIRTNVRRRPIVPLQQHSKLPIAGYSSRSTIDTLWKAHEVFLAQPNLNDGVV